MERNECKPYTNDEFPLAMNRLSQNPDLPKLIQFVFPETSVQEFLKFAKNIKSTEDFQKRVISKAIQNILNQTSDGLSVSGLENCSLEKKYLFLSNHRDILCDPALCTNSLLSHGYQTPKICLGDNLLTHPLIIDLVKMNKGVTVKRNLPPRELLKHSLILSKFIYEQITENLDSVWIAQREGRAKDGNDLTHPGVLKMLTLAGDEPILEQMKKLHIIPVAISYEYDPCDILKAREIYLKATHGTYQKTAHEDTKSIITGIQGYKGKVHINFGKELNEDIELARQHPLKRDQILAVSRVIDRQIHRNYKNWPSNFIAFDLIENNDSMKSNYSTEEKEKFITRLKSQLSLLEEADSDKNKIERLILEAYAFPVKNAISATSPQPDGY